MKDLPTQIYSRFTKKDRKYFSDSASRVAPWLLGKILCRRISDKEVLRFYITETEAYEHDDESCYGYGGKKNEANAPLFEQGGTCCIYSEMLLISCGEAGKPDNVLIRAVGNTHTYCHGPVIVYEKLRLDKTFSGLDILTSDQLWLENVAGERLYCQTMRVGLSEKVKQDDRDLKHRFIIL